MASYVVPLTIHLESISTTICVTADSPKEAQRIAEQRIFDDSDLLSQIHDAGTSIYLVEPGEPKAE